LRLGIVLNITVGDQTSVLGGPIVLESLERVLLIVGRELSSEYDDGQEREDIIRSSQRKIILE
jgi:hypothetical protein